MKLDPWHVHSEAPVGDGGGGGKKTESFRDLREDTKKSDICVSELWERDEKERSIANNFLEVYQQRFLKFRER